jgi:hypothetical protein
MQKYKSIKTIWPFQHGYGVYFKRAGNKILICDGWTKAEADEYARQLNNNEKPESDKVLQRVNSVSRHSLCRRFLRGRRS